MDGLVLANDVAQLRHRSQQVIANLPVIPQDLPEMPEIVSEGPRQFEQNIRGVLRHLKKVRKALKRAGADESFAQLDHWQRAVKNQHDVVQESPETFVEYERTGRLPVRKFRMESYSSLNTQQQPSTPVHSDGSTTLQGSPDGSAPSSNGETEHDLDDSSHDSTSPATFDFTFPEHGAAPSAPFVFSSSEGSSNEDMPLEDCTNTVAQEGQQSVLSGQEPDRQQDLPEDNDVVAMAGDEEGLVAEEIIAVEENALSKVVAQEVVDVAEPEHEAVTTTSPRPSGFTLPQTGTGLSHVFPWMASQEAPQEDEVLESSSDSEPSSDTGADGPEPAVAQEAVEFPEPEHKVDTSTSSSSSGFTLPQTGTGLSHVFVWMGSQESSQEDEPLEASSDTGAQETSSAPEQPVVVEEPVMVDSEYDSSLGDTPEATAEASILEADNSDDASPELALIGVEVDFVCNEATADEESTLTESSTLEAETAVEDILSKNSDVVEEVTAASATDMPVQLNDKSTSTTTAAANGQACYNNNVPSTTVPLHFSKVSPTSGLVGATAGAFMAAKFPVVSACMLYAGIAYAKYSLNH